MFTLLSRICGGTGTMEDLDLLVELCGTIKETSLCGLGMTAPNPVLSTLRYFRNEYMEHIVHKRCPACVCNIAGATVAEEAPVEVLA
jgi:NADH:ubiquinone oxidoreductase subunit F (NADH-binding)